MTLLNHTEEIAKRAAQISPSNYLTVSLLSDGSLVSDEAFDSGTRLSGPGVIDTASFRGETTADVIEYCLSMRGA